MLGVGIGAETTGEFDPGRFGEEGDMRERARLLDEGLEQLVRYWDGEFEPRPGQRAHPRLGRRALAAQEAAAARRALAGLFPVETESARRRAGDEGGAGDGLRRSSSPTRPEVDPAPWFAAGATWCLTGFGPDPKVADVERAIDAGPWSGVLRTGDAPAVVQPPVPRGARDKRGVPRHVSVVGAARCRGRAAAGVSVFVNGLIAGSAVGHDPENTPEGRRAPPNEPADCTQ